MELDNYLPGTGEINAMADHSGEIDVLPMKRFWEFDNMFVCPAIGMCLSLSEQKQIIKKCKISLKNKNAFEIHELLVACAEGENRLSMRVDNLLCRKFKKTANDLLALDCDTFMTHWQSAFNAGNYVDVFWAAASRPDLPPKYRRQVFGDIHMSMHWNAEQNSRQKQKMDRIREEMETLRNDAKDAARGQRQRKKENSELQQRILELEKTVRSLETQHEDLIEKTAQYTPDPDKWEQDMENARLEKGKNILKAMLKDKNDRIASLETQNAFLSAELSDQRELMNELRNETRTMANEFFSQHQCTPSCPSFNLCRKRYLIVGGITRMESLYRQVIEGSGGRMEYHDGYMKSGCKKLENLLKRSDVVLCPVSCNSHAACSMVKNLAKKYKKPVHMLTNSSLSAVTQALLDENNQQAVIN